MGNNPIDEGYPQHRKSEDDTKLEVDLNEPFSDEEGEDDDEEDDFNKLKSLIGNRTNKNFSSNSNIPINDIERFLQDNKLLHLKPLVNDLKLSSLEQLKAFTSDDIKQFFGIGNNALSDELIKALNKLTI